MDIYKYHGIDSDSIVEGCGKALAETAMETIQVSQRTLGQAAQANPVSGDWKQWWEQKS